MCYLIPFHFHLRWSVTYFAVDYGRRDIMRVSGLAFRKNPNFHISLFWSAQLLRKNPNYPPGEHTLGNSGTTGRGKSIQAFPAFQLFWQSSMYLSKAIVDIPSRLIFQLNFTNVHVNTIWSWRIVQLSLLGIQPWPIHWSTKLWDVIKYLLFQDSKFGGSLLCNNL